jgi:lipopolysaccharide/colanic/teichoic acid biosynthesis glycosyltransferase
MNMIIKRYIDTIGSLVILFLSVPILGIIALQIRNKLGSPVFFKQERPGFLGESFEMIKFRTMSEEVDNTGKLLSDSERLKPFGVLLRSTSLDELPELWNVLKGEMSLVGPRPLMMEYLPLYSEEQARRHEVKPGITGWAQVNGRNAITWEEKFKLDVWYVDNQSLWLDLKILFITLKKVLVRDGINAEGEITMPQFTGKQAKERS